MLPIGRLFNGISATVKGKPGTLRLASEATGDTSTDPCYTLEGWKLDSTTVTFDDLNELPQLQGSGLSVCRRESLQLHIAFQDQFGAPIEVRGQVWVVLLDWLGREAGNERCGPKENICTVCFSGRRKQQRFCLDRTEVKVHV